MEHRVAEALEARGVEVFAPVIEYHGRSGALLDKPFFPRYIFAHFDWDSEGYASVQWTPGLSCVVNFDGRPAWLEDEYVAYLRAELEVLDGDEFLALKPGERVRVTDGPFRDLEAIFAGRMNGEQRVAVLLEILGRPTRVEVDSDIVRRIA
jgi:transcriptional antiterminator RfaH